MKNREADIVSILLYVQFVFASRLRKRRKISVRRERSTDDELASIIGRVFDPQTKTSQLCLAFSLSLHLTISLNFSVHIFIFTGLIHSEVNQRTIKDHTRIGVNNNGKLTTVLKLLCFLIICLLSEESHEQEKKRVSSYKHMHIFKYIHIC